MKVRCVKAHKQLVIGRVYECIHQKQMSTPCHGTHEGTVCPQIGFRLAEVPYGLSGNRIRFCSWLFRPVDEEKDSEFLEQFIPEKEFA